MNFRLLLPLVAVTAGSAAYAGTVVSAECTNNLTIQNAGPRQGANGLRGFNVQGLNGVSFASYAIAEWTAAPFGLTGSITNINSVTLQLEKWHAAFSTIGGNLSVWMTSSYGLSMDQALAAASPFKFSFDAGDVPWGMDRTALQFIGPSLPGSPFLNAANQPVGSIATFNFIPGATGAQPDGFVYQVPLNLTTEIKDEIKNRLNAGQTLRFIVAPETVDVVGVFAGYTNTGTNPATTLTRVGPTLIIDADLVANATGTVDFGQLGGTPYNSGTNLPTSLAVSFRDASNTEIATGTATYDPVTGAFSAAVPGTVTGPYRVSFKHGFWLRKTMPNPADPAAPLGSYAFGTVAPQVGDADDDNAVTPSDYGIWQVENGTFPTENTGADFDGDGAVTPSDYGLWQVNNGAFGDD